MAQLPFRSYEGGDPYIFISYSHRDADLVFEIIGRLNELGFPMWYDEGIEPGTEWPEEIAAHLKGCSAFLLFMSPNAMESHNVRREINFAIDNKARLFCVNLQEVELSPGLQMQLSLIQSINYTYPETEGFYRRLDSVLSQAVAKRDGALAGAGGVSGKAKKYKSKVKPPKPKKPKGKPIVPIILCCVVLLASVALVVFAYIKFTGDSDDAARGCGG